MWTVYFFKRNKKMLERLLRRYVTSSTPIPIDRALVLSKMTRYEVEKMCNPHLAESKLEHLIRSRGSNYDSLVEHHQRHKEYEKYVLDAFKQMGITTKFITRSEYTEASVESSDVVFPVGGDGTFLLAASRVRDNLKPVIGFNSDPLHSEGFLCINRKYSFSVKDVLQRLKEGSFSWMFRARIRVTLLNTVTEPQGEFPDKKVLGSHRTELNQCVKKHMSTVASSRLSSFHSSGMLPALALNEVFVGESLSAQVSYFEMKMPPSEETTRVKSSGLCVSTGTGSSSWHLSMNRITSLKVAQILKCAGLSPTPFECEEIANKYNNSLLFDPERLQLCYTVRDLISAGVWPSPPGLAPRGFAPSLWIRSRCRDARLVIDGGVSYSFNDGSEALLELHSSDTLRTVVL